MKKKRKRMRGKRICIAMISLFLTTGAVAQELRVLTYNIRYDNPGDGPDSWPVRRSWLCNQVRQADPDIFGIQEGLMNQVEFIDSLFGEYRHIGVGRDDGHSLGEFSAIFYNTLKYKVLREQTFWLSPHSERPSIGWDAALKRICTWGLFQEISTERKFLVFNTHFDHMGVEARKNSAILILEKIRQVNRQYLPVILMGDFNGGPESEPVRILSQSLCDSKPPTTESQTDPGGTFNGFDASKPQDECIDFIFTSKKGLHVTGYKVLREMHDGHFPSDHFPVTVTLKFTNH